MDVFAEAYSEMSGSGLKGQEGIAAFYAAVESGKLESAKILPIVSRLLAERAEPKLGIMKKTSIAEQAREQNAAADWVFNFGQSGGEAGFARMWKSLSIALKEAAPLAEKLGKGFNEMSKYASRILLLPQSIQRAFDGRDSWFADAVGKERVETLRSWYENQKEIFAEVGKLLDKVVEGWKLIFDLWGADMLAFVDKFSLTILYLMKALNAALEGDFKGSGNAMAAFAAVQGGASKEAAAKIAAGEMSVRDGISGTPGFEWDWKMMNPVTGSTHLGEGIGNQLSRFSRGFKSAAEEAKIRQNEFRGLVSDPESPFFNKPEAAREYMNKSMELEERLLKGSTTNSNEFNIEIKVDPATLENMNVQKQAEDLGAALQIVLQQNPVV
jgi:hypothetical protein